MNILSIIVSVLSFVNCENILPKYYKYPVQEDYIPIMGYHRVEGNDTYDTTITLEEYEYQIEYMTNTMQCNWITMEQLSYYILNDEKTPTNACVITFDDGHYSQYHNALNILKKYKILATFYLNTDHVTDKYNSIGDYYMGWREVEVLSMMGHDISSHCKTHPDLSELSYSEQEDEIIDSKHTLERKYYKSTSLAYPHGQFNDDTIEILEKSTYLLGRAIETWEKRDKRPSTLQYGKWELYYYDPIHFITYPERIYYTGWWQFEENYVNIGFNEEGVLLKEESMYRPTDTSYAVLLLSNEGNEVETNFLTKNQGSFSIEIIISKNNTNFDIYVDNNKYIFYKGSDEYYNIYGSTFYNYYIDIENLKSGLHYISVRNNEDIEMYVDKYRIFSDASQDFMHVTEYKELGYEIIYPDCTAYLPLIADGKCHSSTNNEECGWDGGDCCEDTCNHEDCGYWGYVCLSH